MLRHPYVVEAEARRKTAELLAEAQHDALVRSAQAQSGNRPPVIALLTAILGLF